MPQETSEIESWICVRDFSRQARNQVIKIQKQEELRSRKEAQKKFERQKKQALKKISRSHCENDLPEVGLRNSADNDGCLSLGAACIVCLLSFEGHFLSVAQVSDILALAMPHRKERVSDWENNVRSTLISLTTRKGLLGKIRVIRRPNGFWGCKRVDKS